MRGLQFRSSLKPVADENEAPRRTREKPQAPVVQKVDSAIHRINLYPVDSAIGFPDTYPLDIDLSGG